MKKLAVYVLTICLFFAFNSCEKVNNHKSKPKKIKEKYKNGYRYDENGWIFVHIEGEPYERGYQHGYLVAQEYHDTMQCYSAMGYETMGMKICIKEADKNLNLTKYY